MGWTFGLITDTSCQIGMPVVATLWEGHGALRPLGLRQGATVADGAITLVCRNAMKITKWIEWGPKETEVLLSIKKKHVS